MSLIGYARVSTDEQSLEVQLDSLRQVGCDRIFAEKASGRSAERPELKDCLEFLREGDVFVFTRLDRIGRSLVDLVNIGRQLQDQGVAIRCLEQPIDTSTPEGRLMWGVLAVVAEFEVDLIRERQLEGVAAAKARGVYKGRKPTVTRELVAELKAQGLGATAIAKKLRCDKTTVYRAHPEGWGPSPIGGR